MAVVDLSSDLVTNFNAVPRVMNDGFYSHGRLRRLSESLEIGATDENGSIYRMIPVHSSWSVVSLWLYNDAITSGTSFDVGLYTAVGDGGTSIDIDAYASAVSLTAARVAPLDVTFEARNIANLNHRIWQDGGFAVDPSRFFEICLTANTVGSSGGTVSLTALYTDGS
jgi:hypothetical protein